MGRGKYGREFFEAFSRELDGITHNVLVIHHAISIHPFTSAPRGGNGEMRQIL
jgi:hypothetical protein